MSGRPSLSSQKAKGLSPESSSKSLPTFILTLGLLAVAAFIAFQPSLRGDWLWDDRLEILGEPFLRSGWGIWRAWIAPSGSDYLPLKTTLQWLQWQCWGELPTGYHLVSLVGHVLSGGLLVLIVKRLGLFGGALAGLFFVVHPLAVESVSWISEQKNTLSLPFALAAFLCFLRFERTRAKGALICSLALFCAGMLCKASIVILPVILVMYVWWRYRTIPRWALFSSVPFFVVAVVIGLLTISFQQTRAIGSEPLPQDPLLVRCTRASWAVCFYAAKVFWPKVLSPIYAGAGFDPPKLSHLLASTGLLMVTLLLWFRRTAWGRGPLFAFTAFVACLAPTLGLIPISYLRISWVADHFAYVALTLPAVLTGVLLGRICHRRGTFVRVIGYTAACGLILALALRSRSYARNFVNEEVFWTATLRSNPEAWPAHNNLGNLAAAHGRPEDAAAHFRAALALRPNEASLHNNLGNSLRALGHEDDALLEYQAALKLRPRYPEAHYNLGGVWRHKGDRRRAAEEYEAALQEEPNYPDACSGFGDLLAEGGRPQEAIEYYRRALRLRPDYAEAHNNLGIALAELSRVDEALPEFAEAVRLKPDYADAVQNLATARSELSARLPGR